MAGFRGLCQSWGILSGWNSGGSGIGFCSTFAREGPLDGINHRSSGAICSAFYYNILYGLEKKGSYGKLPFPFTKCCV